MAETPRDGEAERFAEAVEREHYLTGSGQKACSSGLFSRRWREPRIAG